jgi:pyridoxamine 5'-phosphate oxidase
MDLSDFDSNMSVDPFTLFSDWFTLRMRSGGKYPEAFALSTSGSDNRISSRIVLLKDYSDGKFTFFTNYDSHKGEQLAQNNHAAMLFYWPEISCQIRIEGVVEKLTREESEEYFRYRPRESQAGAWASRQSRVIPSKSYLEEEFKRYLESYNGKEIPLPDYWGGYYLVPDLFEFWQEGEHRLHDRIEYRLVDSKWSLNRLSP